MISLCHFYYAHLYIGMPLWKNRVLLFLSGMVYQHPLMPPYGTPVPYPALYPPGGVYAHPNMTMVIKFP